MASPPRGLRGGLQVRVADHLAAGARAQRGEGRQADRLADELRVPVGEEAGGPAGVEAVRLVVVPLVEGGGAAGRRGAALARAVGAGAVKAERPLAVGPADPLVVRQP